MTRTSQMARRTALAVAMAETKRAGRETQDSLIRLVGVAGTERHRLNVALRIAKAATKPGSIVVAALLFAPALVRASPSAVQRGWFTRTTCTAAVARVTTDPAKRAAMEPACRRAGQRARKMTQPDGDGLVRAALCPFLAGGVDSQVPYACSDLKVGEVCAAVTRASYEVAMEMCRGLAKAGFPRPAADEASEEDPAQPIRLDYPRSSGRRGV